MFGPHRQARKGALLLVAAIATASTLSACGSDEPDPRVQEITKRGFQDVVKGDNGSVRSTYYGTMGACRVRIDFNEPSYMAVQGDTKVPDPSVSLLRTVPEFGHCFKGEATSPTTQPTK